MKPQKIDSIKTKNYLEKVSALFSEQLAVPNLGFSTRELSERLLAKAPSVFLANHSIEFLASLVSGAAAVIGSYEPLPKAVVVKKQRLEDRVVFYILLPDSPFIIKTLENIMERFQLRPWAILHPILSVHNHDVSATALVIDSRDDRPQLEDAISSSLKALRHTISDYQQMIAAATHMSSLLTESQRELGAFLHWLTRNSFVFLGALTSGTSGALGLLKDAALGKSFLEESHLLVANPDRVVRIFSELSPIHNRKRLIGISVSHQTESLVIVGIFSSRGHADEASEVPFLNRKVKEVLLIDGAKPNTYDYKKTVVTLNSVPKLELLSLNSEQLHRQLQLTHDAQFLETSQIKLHRVSEGFWAFAALPEERFGRDTKESFREALEHEFRLSQESVEVLITSLNEEVTRLHAFVPHASMIDDQQLANIEERLHFVTSGWFGQVERLLEGSIVSKELVSEWLNAFSKQYTALTDPDLAVVEVAASNELDTTRNYVATFHTSAAGIQQITFASLLAPVALSKAIPMLEHSHLEVFQAEPLQLKRPDGSATYLQRFSIRPKTQGTLSSEVFKTRLKPLFEAMLREEVEDDELNGLSITADLSYRDIHLLRTYYNILWQFERSASRGVIRSSLANYPTSTKLLVELFRLKFDPNLLFSKRERDRKFALVLEEFRDGLRAVKDITDDRILRAIAAIIEHTVRSTFYHQAKTIAHKIHSAQLDIVRGSRPLFEIFVFNTAFEGVHLRSSRVSRGGIRWSDRREDYRTEILGLMRTQRVKNCLIVPSGAKGGFVLRNVPAERVPRDAHVKNCYEEYIRALLSLADNKVGGTVVHPAGLMIYDAPDPYFVVAADKGTASFSDFANTIAQKEFGFWLDDAFASGGSRGYSHKALGITAKGAWEASKVHLNTLGIDYLTKSVSVVGIGDMSGDVFGNGLLMSENFKLLGAFNHAHVFVDPTPDAKLSFAERQRLFALPYSQWTDYAPNLISTGGGVYNRYDKEITLTPQLREALKIDAMVPAVVSGEQLISFILKAPVDLLWNGGIGTYVKSAHESDADVNDGANDRVRVNANELRARAVAEGGNLGFSARARVEYNRLGGKINSDAIDNSAGVDLSDHEVNLKLFFEPLIVKKEITREERDKLLQQAADDVVTAVIANNRYHSLLITIAENASFRSLEYFKGLMRDLVDRGLVQRKQDGLPEEEELDKRQASRQGLTRPELAVLLAGVKMWVKQELEESTFVLDSTSSKFLFSYFPPTLVERYGDALTSHSLQKHIIATEATNRLIDIVGITFVHRASLSHAVTVPQVFQATLAIYELLGIKDVLKEVEKLYSPKSFTVFLECFIELGRVVRESASWLLTRHRDVLTTEEFIEKYRALPEILHQARAAIAGRIAQVRGVRVKEFTDKEVAASLATELADFPLVIFSLESINAGTGHKDLAQHVLNLILQIIDLLNLGTLFEGVGGQGQLTRWEHELRLSAYGQIRHGVGSLAMKALAQGIDTPERLQQIIQRSPSYPLLKSMLTELQSRSFDVAILPAIARCVEEFRLKL